ncbi:MAG: penicillin-binding protein activator LpoB, partial [Gammaproteobacteria bacterium]
MLRRFVWIGVALGLFGCATTETVYREPESGIPAVKTTRFQHTDLQMIASQMITSLLNSPVIGDKRPIVAFGEVRNKTDQHIDTKLISDK